MKSKKEPLCPLLKKPCIEGDCAWYTEVRGTNPNTGQEIDHYACAISWLPTLLVDNSAQQRATGAAVESFRNEVVKTSNNNKILNGLAMQEHLRLQGNGYE